MLRAGSLAKEEASVGKFLHQAAFFQLGKHLEEGAAAGSADLESTGEVFQGSGAVSKLQKTKDVIRTELRLARHPMTPFRGATERV